MARKKRHPEHANHERWLVSYADFMTLLFAFFVVMFASSQTDRGKAAQISESVKKALEENQIASAISGLLGGTVDNKGVGNAMMRGPGGTRKATADPVQTKIAELLPSQAFLNQELKDEIAAGKVQIHMGSRGLVVSLKEAAFFPPGDATVSTPAYGSLEKIATAMRQLPNPARLEGHTDSIPINNSRFHNNWELSAARSIAVLELLTAEFHVRAESLAVAGYADTVPLESNDTPAGRARNRRVDIIILNQSGVTAEPAAQTEPKPSPFPEKKH